MNNKINTHLSNPNNCTFQIQLKPPYIFPQSYLSLSSDIITLLSFSFYLSRVCLNFYYTLYSYSCNVLQDYLCWQCSYILFILIAVWYYIIWIITIYQFPCQGTFRWFLTFQDSDFFSEHPCVCAKVSLGHIPKK